MQIEIIFNKVTGKGESIICHTNVYTTTLPYAAFSMSFINHLYKGAKTVYFMTSLYTLDGGYAHILVF